MSKAPQIREQIDASERALAVLKASLGRHAGRPEAVAKLQALNRQISAAQASRHKLRNALRFALQDDRKSAERSRNVIAARPSTHQGAAQ
jgi:hypothetical protein